MRWASSLEPLLRFSDNGVSVDFVSTSETNVTVSIDTSDGMLPDDVEESLVHDLEKLCRVSVISNCSAVSLVGRKIRTIMPRLAPAHRGIRGRAHSPDVAGSK